jgi:hypothetical protein
VFFWRWSFSEKLQRQKTAFPAVGTVNMVGSKERLKYRQIAHAVLDERLNHVAWTSESSKYTELPKLSILCYMTALCACSSSAALITAGLHTHLRIHRTSSDSACLDVTFYVEKEFCYSVLLYQGESFATQDLNILYSTE